MWRDDKDRPPRGVQESVRVDKKKRAVDNEKKKNPKPIWKAEFSRYCISASWNSASYHFFLFLSPPHSPALETSRSQAIAGY